ncbi:Sulfite reductase [ferredoxin] [compost metagenome]
MLSPVAGLDPQLLFDTRPLAQQLLQSLETTPRFHQLSAKFAVQLDGGEALAMLEHPHDLWLSPLNLDGELWLAFGLAGCPAKDAPLGAVPLTRGHELVLAVLNRFLDLARPEQTRMRQLLSEHAPEVFIAGLGLPIRADAAVCQWRRSLTAASYLGIYPQLQTGLSAVGAAAPLGRLNPSMLRGAARLAREQGDGTLRMTPWQSLLLPAIAQRHAERVSEGLAQLGLLVSASEQLSRLVACTGSAGCAKGQAETKGDARLLATLLAPGAPASVHLSGCPRSCAMAHVAPATLLAQSPGHYDLYLRDDAQPGFGQLHARNLTLKEAGALLDACSRSTLDD